MKTCRPSLRVREQSCGQRRDPRREQNAQAASHVSTGRTLVLTIRPRGPVFVFTAIRYCSAAKFNLMGICKQYKKACCVCVCARACVCVCVWMLVSTQWSVGLCTELLISWGQADIPKATSLVQTLCVWKGEQKKGQVWFCLILNKIRFL